MIRGKTLNEQSGNQAMTNESDPPIKADLPSTFDGEFRGPHTHTAPRFDDLMIRRFEQRAIDIIDRGGATGAVEAKSYFMQASFVMPLHVLSLAEATVSRHLSESTTMEATIGGPAASKTQIGRWQGANEWM